MAVFVVHEHHASHLHFDLRLEMGGVLKSWAVPKGPSMNPAEKRLAIAVEDHALEYGSFEGVIPEGRYGAGAVAIWDRGGFELKGGGTDEGMLEFILSGKKLKGAFVLARMSGKHKEWLLIKKKDGYEEPGFKLKTILTPAEAKKLSAMK
ncbi:MAG: DNA polymerase ligase N-terminal domain-containing protein [Thermodesulfovibrionales bacterium]|nr:DNA polymerase ligase N-terminal domain-containing protein [Thermodesulfovibrionales bacterium]